MVCRVRGAVLSGAIVLAGCGADPSALQDTDAGGSTSGSTTASTVSPTSADTSSTSTGVVDVSSSGGSSSDGGDETTTGGATTDPCDDLEAFVVMLEASDPAETAGMVDAFVEAQQYGEHGLPLRCDERVVFLSTRFGYVAGDFNDWDPEALPMDRPVADAPLWVAETQVMAPGGLYKFVDEGAFVADPLARRYGWDAFGEYSQIDGDPARSHHERWPAFADAVEPLESRTVRVHVPAAVNAGQEVPVLYMHDGQNVFSPDAFFGGWQASVSADALVAEGSIQPVLIVAIDNTPGRLEEYSHVPDDIGDGPVGGLADDYADFVVEGVVPFVEARYPARTGPEHTAVLGSSMGGLVSLHIARRHPDVFGFVGSMSGTLAWGTFGLDNETMIERYVASAPRGASVYIDSGGDGPCPGGGSDNYCEGVALADVLRGQGWEDEIDLFYRWGPGDPHNEAAWAARLPVAFVEWFPGG